MKKIITTLAALSLTACYSLAPWQIEQKKLEARIVAGEDLCEGVDVSEHGWPNNQEPGNYTKKTIWRTTPNQNYYDKLSLHLACRNATAEGQRIKKAESDAFVSKIIGAPLLLVMGAAADAASPTVYRHNIKLSDGSKYRIKHKVYDNRNTAAAVSAITGSPVHRRVHRVDTTIK